MKKFLSLALAGVITASSMSVFASELPDVMKKVSERYSDYIEEAISHSGFNDDEIDMDNIYIVEKMGANEFTGGKDLNLFYVAIPHNETDDIRFASFSKGEYSGESMNTLSWLDKVETHDNTKIEEYISRNELKNVSEAVSIRLSVYGANTSRASINTYKVTAEDGVYYIPYYIKGDYNPGQDEKCKLEFGKAYKEDEFAKILQDEDKSRMQYLEDVKKAEEERLAEEARKEKEKYTPVMGIDQNGETTVKVNGVNLNDILSDLTDAIDEMAFASTVQMGIKGDNEYKALYRWQKGCDTDDVSEFAEGLFEELKTQVQTGKPSRMPESGERSYCTFALKHDEGFKSIRYGLTINIWSDGVAMKDLNDNIIEFKVKNSQAILDYIDRYAGGEFDGFYYEKNDKDTPHIRTKLENVTKTDAVEFEFVLPSDCENSISKEVSTPGKKVKGIFEKYKENKYNSTYILTLSGNLGTISLFTEYQASLDGSVEIYSNNIPIRFSNDMRYENGNLVEYKVGKEGSFKFKMVFSSDDISKVLFDDTECTNLKYTRYTEDDMLTVQYGEKDKDKILNGEKEEEKEEKKEEEVKEEESKSNKSPEATECADALNDLGVLKGTDKGYELEKTLTREESAAILVRLTGNEEKANGKKFEAVFADVDKDRWSYGYVMYCYENEITKGTGKDTFSPTEEIDASQFVTLVMRLLGFTEVSPETAMAKGVEYNLISGDKAEELEQKGTFTRGDMAQIVYSVLNIK